MLTQELTIEDTHKLKKLLIDKTQLSIIVMLAQCEYSISEIFEVQ